MNAHLVLLTRRRDATVVYVPMIQDLDETYQYLVESGFREMNNSWLAIDISTDVNLDVSFGLRKVRSLFNKQLLSHI